MKNKTYSAEWDDDEPTPAALAWSGNCLWRYSIINAIGLAGFSINKLSTIWINKPLIFFEFKYCCNSAWTSAT